MDSSLDNLMRLLDDLKIAKNWAHCWSTFLSSEITLRSHGCSEDKERRRDGNGERKRSLIAALM
ncbi:hypothetical protein PanWU01x14_331060, partial [Parasponia andersonii]